MINTKQIIVMRKDLGMRKGKMIAQGAHASMSFLTKRLQNSFNLLEELTHYQVSWIRNSFTKVCVGVDSEQELLEIKRKAEECGLEVHLITDSGATEFKGIPTNTCLSIGPDESEKIDKITGHLKLL